MIKIFKPALGCSVILLLLQAIILIAPSPLTFVRAQTQKAVRGSSAKNIPTNFLRLRELPETSPTTRAKPKDKDKEQKDPEKTNDKKARTGVATIETTAANGEDIEKDPGRDDVESPAASSGSLWSLESLNDIASEPPTSGSENSFESSPAETPKQSSNNETIKIQFDKKKYVTAEKLQPIIFNVNVSKVANFTNGDVLIPYIKDFVEDVLNMKSNRDWYPLYSKSMNNISIELLPSNTIMEASREKQIGTFPFQLIINGLVFVQAKNQDVVTSTTRNAGGAKQRTKAVKDSESRSNFYDSFDHSMLLYFTFWGIDSLQKVLKEVGGLHKPVIDSIVVGGKQLVTFGSDKDDNYIDKGDHDSSKPKQLPAKAISDDGRRSSARALTYGLLTFVMISATSILY